MFNKSCARVLGLALVFFYFVAVWNADIKAADYEVLVETVSAEPDYSWGMVIVGGRISGRDSRVVVEYGCIYSFDDPNPRLENITPYADGGVVRSEVDRPLDGSNGSTLHTAEPVYPIVTSQQAFSAMYARFYAKDLYGSVYYGETLRVPNITPVTVSLGAAVKTGDTSAVLDISSTGAWEVIRQDWGLYLSTDKSQTRNPGASARQIKAENATDVSSKIYLYDLEPGTIYYASPYMYLPGKQDGFISQQVLSFTTTERPELSLKDIVTVDETSHDSAVFSGSVTSRDAVNILEKGFIYSDIYDNPIAENSAVMRHPDISLGDFSMTVSGLKPDTGYYVRVYAKTSEDVYIYSDSGTFSTTLPKPVKEEPYMTGTGSGIFGPDNYVTNAEAASMLFSLLADPGIAYPSVTYYADVDYSNPVTANTINFVSSQGYMTGSDTGLFLANAPISRAGLAVIVCKVLGLLEEYNGPVPIPSAFADTDGHWSSGYVFLTVMRGFLRGYNEDGVNLFKPENYVTKAELATVFSAMFNRSGEPMGSLNFTDVPPEHWAYRAIMNAAIAGN